MIAQLNGQIISKTGRSLIISVNGVGYEVLGTSEVLSSVTVGKEATLFTHLNVREDLMELYGFLKPDDLAFFKILLTVSGIGPKSALNILEVVKPEDIRRAVVAQDAGLLHTVHGLGKKTAEKLVVELKDKLEAIEPFGVSMSDDQAVLEAITNLGYLPGEVREALKTVKGKGGSLEEKVKLVLRALSRN